MLALLSAIALADPVFSVPRGLYDAPFDLAITPSAGGEVTFSLDGTWPILPVAGPIHVDRTAMVRAVEQLPDGTFTSVATHTYVFVADVLQSAVMQPQIAQDPVHGPIVERSLRELPTVSVVLPAALSLTEIEGSAEWIDPVGEDAQVECGVHIVGGTSWAYPKTSIRLNFRSEYGPSHWDFDVYGPDVTGVAATESFDAISLRSGNHDTMFWLGDRGQHLRNLWFDETQLEMGHVMPHGRFAHVYVNGVYHGLYHVRERFGAGFMESYYGGEEADYETMTGTYVEDGTGAAFAQVVAASGDFATFREWVDVPQYLDYMVLNYYAGNAWDWWSWHNWMASGPTARDARGGFIFHGNDNDITLDYEWNVNILNLGGPDDIFPALLAERHPDFLVALEDAIHRNLASDGPLSTARATDRYDRLAQLADDAIWAESARWGAGWWDHDASWVPERDDLLANWFPRRTDEMLRQFRAAGWYPLDAPTFDLAPGVVPAGAELTVTAAGDGELWVGIGGHDPRLPGGEPAPDAVLATGDTYALPLDHSAVVQARMRVGNTWGPVEAGFFEVVGPSPIVLNEWNAVEPDRMVAQGDDALGWALGNGGDWIELVVTTDGLDLRGWRLTMEDRIGPAGELVFTDDPLLASLRAGTLLTIAEDLAEDAAYDPDDGDWRFHLRAADGASGRYISAADFEVTPLDWQLSIWDAAGNLRYGPVGEAVEPVSGLGSSEVGRLEADPTPDLPRADPAFGAGDRSTYGAPNAWGDSVQDLGWDPEFSPEDPPVVVQDPPVASAEPSRAPAAGGCASAPAAPWLAFAALLVVACGRTTRAPPAAEDSGTSTDPTEPVDRDEDGFSADDCDDLDPRIHPGGIERCDDADDDCDGLVDEDGEVVDGLPFFADADGDGWGADGIVRACRLGAGLALEDGDCDDADPARHPTAVELCDPVDQDCDGEADDTPGSSADCAVESCLALLTAAPDSPDGAYWIATASGAAEVSCDMTGGGWTLGFLRNTAAPGSQAGFGGSDLAGTALAMPPAAASASAIPALGWLDLEALDWTALRVAAYAGGAETFRSREIARSDLRIPFGSDGYLLYGGPTGYYWCGGSTTYTDAGIGAVNNPGGAPPDCKGHGGLGSGWDFSEGNTPNLGLTLCGADGSNWMYGGWATGLVYYGTPGAAQAIWVR
jgi:hypothetical protein